jgi:hypothetical protein
MLLILFVQPVCGKDKASLPFKIGERLIYEVRYKNIAIGESILTFHGERKLQDKNVYYVTFSTKVPSFKDEEELYADINTFLPVEVRRKIKKTVGFDDRITEQYDQSNFKVDIKNRSKLRKKNTSIQKSSPLHNSILLTYYYRTIKDFKKGELLNMNLPTISLDVSFHAVEEVGVPLGKFSAYVFTSNPPKFKLWLSQDEKRLPLKIENPGTLGYSLVLKEVQ